MLLCMNVLFPILYLHIVADCTMIAIDIAICCIIDNRISSTSAAIVSSLIIRLQVSDSIHGSTDILTSSMRSTWWAVLILLRDLYRCCFVLVRRLSEVFWKLSLSHCFLVHSSACMRLEKRLVRVVNSIKRWLSDIILCQFSCLLRHCIDNTFAFLLNIFIETLSVRLFDWTASW